jgi:hypothetical protein
MRVDVDDEDVVGGRCRIAGASTSRVSECTVIFGSS